MKSIARSNLLAVATAFAEAEGVSLASIGQRALKDNTFFSRVASGSNFTVETYDRVVKWLSKNWPEGLLWPDGIERLHDAEAEAAE